MKRADNRYTDTRIGANSQRGGHLAHVSFSTFTYDETNSGDCHKQSPNTIYIHKSNQLKWRTESTKTQSWKLLRLLLSRVLQRPNGEWVPIG